MSPVVPGLGGAPGLAETLRGALRVDHPGVREGEHAGRVRRGAAHRPALLLTGALHVEAAVPPPLRDDLALPVHLRGAPGSLGARVSAALVSDSLVDKWEDTNIS